MYRKLMAGLLIGVLVSNVKGYTPNYDGNASAFDPMDGIVAKKPSVKSPHSVSVSGSQGSMSYFYPMEGLPALLPGGLSLVYNSSARFNRECGYGWSLGGVMEMTRIYDPDYKGGAVYDEDKLYRLEGGGVGGLVRFNLADSTYKLHDVGGKDVKISKTPMGWSVQDGSGLTWRLEAQPKDSELWRATTCVDLKGNYVQYEYDSKGRLTSLRYTGNTKTGDSGLVTVELEYSPRDHVYYSALYNAVEAWDKYVSAVVVKARGWGKDDVVRRYDIDVEQDGAVILYKKITATGYDESGTATVGEPVAFDYNDYTELSDEDREEETDLDHVGTTSEHINVVYSQEGYSWQEKGFEDFNGDGLMDCVEVDGLGSWKIWLQRVDENTRAHRFSSLPDVTISKGPPVHMTEWMDGKQLVAFEDINNDGYPDVISAMQYSLESGGKDSESGLFSGRHLGASSGWGVWYGTGTGFSARVFESAPYSSIRRQSITGADNGNKYAEFMDVNGDGWKDVIYASPGDGIDGVAVYYHESTKGAGWGSMTEQAAPWMAALEDKFVEGLSQEDYDLARVTTSPDPVVARYVVTDRYTWGQFLDFNRDGWIDYVISANGASLTGAGKGSWTVYFGLPSGHWSAPTTVKSGLAYLNHSVQYNAGYSGIRTGTYDVDGDGLLDVLSEGVWYKNMGDIIDSSGRTLPERMRKYYLTGFSETSVDIDAAPSSLESGYAERAKQKTVADLTDVDGDGLIDLMDGGYLKKVEYAAYPRAYMLKAVTRGGGLKTAVNYRAASSTYPRGQVDQTQNMSSVMDLVDYVQTLDEVTDDYLYTAHDYRYGQQERAVCLGFAEHDVEQIAHVQIPGEAGYSLKRSASKEYYDGSIMLTYGGVVKTNEIIYTDLYGRFAPNFDTSAGSTKVMDKAVLNTAWTYARTGTHYLVSAVHVRETGEDDYLDRNPRESEITMVYDEAGYLLRSYVDGNGDGFLFKQDDINTVINYTSDSSGLVVRPSDVTTYGYDPLKSKWRALSLEKYKYDSDMAVERKEYASGDYYKTGKISDASIYITLGRTSRGAVKSITRREGFKVQTVQKTSCTFGDAVVAESEDINGKKTVNTVDAQGRVTETKDPNGFVAKKIFDGLGRVIYQSIVDLDGDEHLLSQASYDTDEAPYCVKSTTYESDGAVQNVSLAFLNGQGQPYQTITDDDEGHKLAVDTYYNLSGELVYNSKPYFVSDSSMYGKHNDAAGLLAVNYYDGLGRLREVWADYEHGVGPNLVFLGTAGEVIEEDAEGYQKTTYSDNFGRPTNVTVSGTTLGTYAYDGLGTLVSFKDANGNETKYYYDGVGRLTQSSGPDIGDWYRTYQFANLLVLSNSAGDVVKNTYDALDRMTLSEFTDPIRGAVEYTWAYDGSLYGKVDKVTDPAGYEVYTYDNLGREKSALRHFEKLNGIEYEAAFAYTFDLQGKPVTKTYPSGMVLTNEYQYGYKKATAFSDGARVTYDYNTYGKIDQIENNLGMTWDYSYYGDSPISVGSPLFLKSIEMTTPEETIGRGYSWYDNALLKAKWNQSPSLGGAALAGEGYLKYTYDDFQQLTQVDQNNSSGVGFSTYESFEYDANGNLKKQFTTDGDTFKYTLASGNKVSAKKQTTGGTVESYEYDNVGRTISADPFSGPTTTYAYNTQGRLVDIKKDGASVETYSYSPNGELILISHGDLTSGNYTLRFRDWELEVDNHVALKAVTTTEAAPKNLATDPKLAK